jgi:chemotaxis protein MotC
LTRGRRSSWTRLGRTAALEAREMNLRPLARALILLVAAVAPGARAAEADRTISQAIGDLQRLQARMAQGDKAAYALQRDRLRTVGALILGAKPETWKDKSETDAAAVFVLGGGPPGVLSQLLDKNVIPAAEEPLLRGAAAYASGRLSEAETLLGGLDPAKASLKLAGQLAFAQSVLKTQSDPKRAIALLDLARLISPGALVEEAALRREILLLGEQRDGDRIVFLSRQYVSRFGRSIYADNFIQGLAAATIRFGLIDDIPGLEKFRPLLSTVTPDERRGFMLAIARAQILSGKTEVASVAAREAMRDTPAGTADEARARLFSGAAQIVTSGYDAGVATLRGVDRSKLGKADQGLLDAAIFVAARLRDPPANTFATEPAREAPEPPAPGQASAQDRQIASARATIARASQILGRTAALARDEGTPP